MANCWLGLLYTEHHIKGLWSKNAGAAEGNQNASMVIACRIQYITFHLAVLCFGPWLDCAGVGEWFWLKWFNKCIVWAELEVCTSSFIFLCFSPTSTQEERNHHCRFNFVEVFSEFKLLLPSSVCYRWLPVNFTCIWGLAEEESQVMQCNLAYVSSQWKLKESPIISLLYLSYQYFLQFLLQAFSSNGKAKSIVKLFPFLLTIWFDHPPKWHKPYETSRAVAPGLENMHE